MLEIVIIGLIIIGVGVWLWRRSPKKNSAQNDAVTFVCPHCGEKDCHCERRS